MTRIFSLHRTWTLRDQTVSPGRACDLNAQPHSATLIPTNSAAPDRSRQSIGSHSGTGSTGHGRRALVSVAGTFVGLWAGNVLAQEPTPAAPVPEAISTAAVAEAPADAIPNAHERPVDLPSLEPQVQRRAQQRLQAHLAAVRLAHRSIGLSGDVVATGLGTLESRGIESLIRPVIDRLAAQTGLEISIGRIRGGALSGTILLDEMTVKGVANGTGIIRKVPHNDVSHDPDSPETTSRLQFDLTCARAVIHCGWWDLIGPNPSVAAIRLHGIRGHIHRLNSDGKTGSVDPHPWPHDASPDTGQSPTRPTLTTSSASVGQLQISDLALRIADEAADNVPMTMDLEVETLECRHFRPSLAPYDLIFRSQTAGRLNGQSVSVSSVETDQGHKSEWQAEKLPINLLRIYLGGPFRVLSEGTCDLRVRQVVLHDPLQPVLLTASFKLRDLTFGIPPTRKPAVGIAAQAVLSQLKVLPTQKDLTFELRLDPDSFDLTQIESRERLWSQFREAAVTAMLQTTGIAPQGIKDDRSRRAKRNAEVITEEALRTLERIRERRKTRRLQQSNPNSPGDPATDAAPVPPAPAP